MRSKLLLWVLSVTDQSVSVADHGQCYACHAKKGNVKEQTARDDYFDSRPNIRDELMCGNVYRQEHRLHLTLLH